ncbi:hypothetical protein Hypma_006883 [Hypsizygus marmoreus]|uniref:Uncharacterized protein n=1 Tax=Hypsizygus marmoreus TaxID=39966 RepID=A0A369K3Z6_HYPMA|nr:hypothetical protein Hypma_006883 [Hypsizygus marmoreus]
MALRVHQPNATYLHWDHTSLAITIGASACLAQHLRAVKATPLSITRGPPTPLRTITRGKLNLAMAPPPIRYATEAQHVCPRLVNLWPALHSTLQTAGRPHPRPAGQPPPNSSVTDSTTALRPYDSSRLKSLVFPLAKLEPVPQERSGVLINCQLLLHIAWPRKLLIKKAYPSPALLATRSRMPRYWSSTCRPSLKTPFTRAWDWLGKST